MIDTQTTDVFWGVVEDCLVEIHKLPRMDAQTRVSGLRFQVDQPPAGLSSEIVYHDEPFDVACDLAGQRLGLAPYRRQYDVILQRHNW